MASSILPLDVFGQSPRLHGLYTQLCFTFELDHLVSAKQLEVENHLRAGLKYLADRIPWVGGHVVKTANGLYVIQCAGDSPALVVRDATSELPDYDTMRRAHFPASMLDEVKIASRSTLPTREEARTPVFVVQATFVRDGLLLDFDAQHNCMDMRAQAELIRLFAKACRAEPFTQDEIELADRATHEFGYKDSEVGELEVVETTFQSHFETRAAQTNENSEKPSWAYFSFSSASLARLKGVAAHDITTDFISTDDALSALLWQAVARARRHRIGPADTSCKLERQVDARKHVGVPSEYIGNITFKSETSLTLDTVLEEPLGQVASHLRRALEPTPSIKDSMQSTATKLRRELDSPSSIKASAQRGSLPPSTIRLSSWAKEACAELDFGHLLHMPDAVRRPSFKAWEGLAYFLPRSRDGEIAVMVCLKDDDLMRLRTDEVLCSFGDYIG